MAYAPVQGKAANNASSATPAMTMTSDVTAGNMLVLLVNIVSATVTVNSITDTLGNTYAEVRPATVGAARSAHAWYSQLTVSGPCTFTATMSTAVVTSFAVEEYSGGLPNGTDPRDQGNGGAGTSTTPSSGNITTTYANDLIVGMERHNNTTPTEDASFTNRQLVSSAVILGDRIVTATETRAYAPTLSTSVEWDAIIVSFKDASSVGGGGGYIPPPAFPGVFNLDVKRMI